MLQARLPRMCSQPAACSLLTLGESCTNFLINAGLSVANLNPCRAIFEDYVIGLIQLGRLNGAAAPTACFSLLPCVLCIRWLRRSAHCRHSSGGLCAQSKHHRRAVHR